MLLSTIGGVGMWSVVVALPAIQTEFGVDRADASLPYTLTMLGFGFGGVLMGRLADRIGIAIPLALGTLSIGLGYLAVGHANSLWQVAIAQGLLIGGGCSVTFGPLMADMSHWFMRRRGIAVALAASGNYFAGTIWPPVVQHFIAVAGWRLTHVGIGLFLIAAMLPLIFVMRRRLEAHHTDAASASAARRQAELPLSPVALQVLLCIAGVACCVAMSMPQVHLVAYCGDLGYGVARGADMLSLMLGCGIVSRIGSGFIADRIGGVRTLLLGSVLQGVALTLYLMFDGLFSLYVISALFGLFQGGIVPSYAIIVREYFPRQASEYAGRAGDHGHRGRHGAGRLDVGRDLRSHRFLSGRLPQRHRLEPAQRHHHDVPAAALAAAAEARRGLNFRTPRPAIPWSSLRPTGCGRDGWRFPAACAP